MKVGVVMPVVYPSVNGKSYALEALESVKSHYSWQPYVQANWRENLPLSVSWNKQIDKAINDGCNYILVINDDILLSQWTIDGLIYEFSKDLDNKVVLVSGNNQRGQLANPYDILKIPSPIYQVTTTAPHPDFSCFMVKNSIFSLIGKFDENIEPAYFEDNDFDYRIRLLGYEAIATTAAPYYHYGSVTQNANLASPRVPGWKFDQIKEYYIRKWGGTPGQEVFLNPFNDPTKSPCENVYS